MLMRPQLNSVDISLSLSPHALSPLSLTYTQDIKIEEGQSVSRLMIFWRWHIALLFLISCVPMWRSVFLLDLIPLPRNLLSVCLRVLDSYAMLSFSPARRWSTTSLYHFFLGWMNLNIVCTASELERPTVAVDHIQMVTVHAGVTYVGTICRYPNGSGSSCHLVGISSSTVEVVRS